MLTNKSRRLLMLSALSGTMAGFTLLKKSIKNYGEVYEYLSNPDGKANIRPEGVVVIEGADFSTASFRDIEWDNFRFENCSFGGQYKIMLTKISNCVFENCSFSGILDFGMMLNTKFIHCDGSGEFYLLGSKNSKNVIFEQCEFSGLTDSKARSKAAIGAGEATFLSCNLTKADLFGDNYLSIQNCNCQSVDISQSEEVHGQVLQIKNSEFTGETVFFGPIFIKIKIENGKFEKASFRQVRIDNELIIENCNFKSIDLYVKRAKQITMKNSTVYGDGKIIFDAYAAKIENILIDTCEFYNNGEAVFVAGGISLKGEEYTSYVNKSVVIKNSKIPFLRSVYVNSPSYTLEGCTIDAADFNHSRFGSFTIKNTKINRSINFTATQAKVQDIAGLYGGGLSLAQLEDSNIKLPR